MFHRRRLPHLHAVGQPVFLTWRLAGSLPEGRAFPAELTDGQAFALMDRLLGEARTGPRYLGMAEIAEVVVEAIRYRAGRDYELHAWAVMPNHVHLLVTPATRVSLFLKSLKRHTAREGNRILGLTGQAFWQDESYDRLVRDQGEFQRILRYIEWNPVQAGLAAAPEEFSWSSAWPISNRPQAASLPHGVQQQGMT